MTMETNYLYLTPSQVEKKFAEAGLGLKETLALIEMTWEDTPQGSSLKPSSNLFNNLNMLSHSTVRGSRIKRFKAKGPNHPFQVFEVFTQEKEVLAYINMLYLRKPLPCYYLVYVEVASSFRGEGLGNKILEAFRGFVESKGTMGLLDNIIPPEDPTFDIYTKLGWIPLENLIGPSEGLARGHYMVYRPSSMKQNDLKLKLPKLIFNLKKKRPVIEMQDNELMVQRTIQEFNEISRALEKLFKKEMESGQSSPLMRFMFTKFVTRLLGFQRRIQELVGYTGGESLEQITISPLVRHLPIQPYTFSPENDDFELFGDQALWGSLPQEIKTSSTRAIEKLPIYQRPALKQWMAEKNRTVPLKLTIADILELGFDPTRLRELTGEDQAFIFERLSVGLLKEIPQREAILHKIERKSRGIRIDRAQIKINPPLLWFQDRGNGYILRKKIKGIHWEEAVFQLRKNPNLRFLNQHLNLDQKVIHTIRGLMDWSKTHLRLPDRSILEELAYFVPWNLDKNRPLVSIDETNSPFLETVWIA